MDQKSYKTPFLRIMTEKKGGKAVQCPINPELSLPDLYLTFCCNLPFSPELILV
ncbi:hypothetical protein MTBMA_c10440 [Methanothermobacter marburgensis str. Marburg]|uniref:Uncharacterized protein n=1 Tax=Methanothermobacter marburgensis (strain ATCC BAA-927 / DSM 2133 / JCM 14651 / NBRC 100331 / OCM 82 / Marburg) TaxID=79929 RepID=D9PWP0_METTM|nr:hypothetical protein MTBMA_c10440 [Methanothermobacter marburgensis str. Marburg]